ncbi:MAG TPA: SulP family inorganic anion transporter [Bacteroidia bacterium]|nr:SulP family inorganic anion transporter [Bacteroidia bacterium]
MFKKENFSADFTASLVVFFVALPLCLGIALASGAPIISGLIAGITGGLIVGLISKSQTSVSGPAAGLTVIVLTSIEQLNGFQIFLCALAIAGILQVLLGLIGAGIIGNFVPSSVIKGMLAAIGLILIFKQLPHAFGYDKDYEGDESFEQIDHHNTFTELLELGNHFTIGAIIIALITFIILYLGETEKVKRIPIFKVLPISLVAIITGTLASILFDQFYPTLQLEPEHLVQIPIVFDKSNLNFPDFGQIGNTMVWIVAIKLALVASLETLLSIEATDKLDPEKRITPTSRELVAQGAGNFVSSIVGGLPVTAVIVRSSANIVAGAKTKLSTILHGLMLVVFVLIFPKLLNKIPLSSLAVLLIFVGFKLTKPSLYAHQFKNGIDQFLPFIITVISIVFSDLLIGVGIGFFVSLFFIVRSSFQRAVSFTTDEKNILIKFRGNVSFLNKAFLRDKFESIPEESYMIIDGTAATYIDKDIIELLDDLQELSTHRNIKIEKKLSKSSLNPYFRPTN